MLGVAEGTKNLLPSYVAKFPSACSEDVEDAEEDTLEVGEVALADDDDVVVEVEDEAEDVEEALVVVTDICSYCLYIGNYSESNNSLLTVFNEYHILKRKGGTEEFDKRAS